MRALRFLRHAAAILDPWLTLIVIGLAIYAWTCLNPEPVYPQ